MRFLIFSDLHLHNWAYGANVANGFNSRLLSQLGVIQQLVKYAVDNEIEHVFFCGDWFHRNSSIDTEVLMISHQITDLFRQAKLQLYVIAGNHDMKDREGKIHSLSHLKPNTTELVTSPLGAYRHLVKFRTGETVPFCFFPYVEHKKQLEEHFFKIVESDSICIIHQGIANVSVGSGFVINEIFDPGMVPDRVLHVFSGHYHTFQRVAPKVTIPGSPLQLTWADANETKGWLDCELTGKHLKVTQVTSYAPKFIRISQSAIERLADGALLGNFVRIEDVEKVSMIDEVRSQAIRLGAGSTEVEVRMEMDPSPKTSQALSVEEVVREFIEAKNLPPALADVGQKIMAGEKVA